MSAHIDDKNDYYEYNCTEYFQGHKTWTVRSKKKLTELELRDIVNDPEHQPTDGYETWTKDIIDAEGEDSIKVSYDGIFEDDDIQQEINGDFHAQASRASQEMPQEDSLETHPPTPSRLDDLVDDSNTEQTEEQQNTYDDNYVPSMCRLVNYAVDTWTSTP